MDLICSKENLRPKFCQNTREVQLLIKHKLSLNFLNNVNLINNQTGLVHVVLVLNIFSCLFKSLK